MLDIYNVPLYEEDKFRHLLDNINCPENIWKLRFKSADLSTVLALIQIPHTYQQLYDPFYQRPVHYQEVMDGDGRSTHLWEEKEESEEAYLKAENNAAGVVEESVEEEAKEI